MAKHHLYDESPAIKHDEEGHTRVEKSSKKEHIAGKEEKGVEAEAFPIHVRHGMERRAMHSHHETEHGIHDAAKAGNKKEMHERHEKEHKEMHTRHEKEHGLVAGSKDQGAPIAEIEKGAK